MGREEYEVYSYKSQEVFLPLQLFGVLLHLRIAHAENELVLLLSGKE
jgi:hypothetical protein